ncbi:hypothetical protein NQZ79_g3134 [Umbelopsis isabellina]|nr:hypothetical protein NQZ79_g3134 [Umbelopsis isabellina]
MNSSQVQLSLLILVALLYVPVMSNDIAAIAKHENIEQHLNLWEENEEYSGDDDWKKEHHCRDVLETRQVTIDVNGNLVYIPCSQTKNIKLGLLCSEQTSCTTESAVIVFGTGTDQMSTTLPCGGTNINTIPGPPASRSLAQSTLTESAVVAIGTGTNMITRTIPCGSSINTIPEPLASSCPAQTSCSVENAVVVIGAGTDQITSTIACGASTNFIPGLSGMNCPTQSDYAESATLVIGTSSYQYITTIGCGSDYTVSQPTISLCPTGLEVYCVPKGTQPYESSLVGFANNQMLDAVYSDVVVSNCFHNAAQSGQFIGLDYAVSDVTNMARQCTDVAPMLFSIECYKDFTLTQCPTS